MPISSWDADTDRMVQISGRDPVACLHHFLERKNHAARDEVGDAQHNQNADSRDQQERQHHGSPDCQEWVFRYPDIQNPDDPVGVIADRLIRGQMPVAADVAAAVVAPSLRKHRLLNFGEIGVSDSVS